MRRGCIDRTSAIITVIMANEKIKIIDEFPADFKRNQLPSNGDIIKAIYFKSYRDGVLLKSACDHAAWCIGAIWKRAEVPVISSRGIENRVLRLIEDYQKLLKYDESRNNYNNLVDEFNVSFQSEIPPCFFIIIFVTYIFPEPVPFRTLY